MVSETTNRRRKRLAVITSSVVLLLGVAGSVSWAEEPDDQPPPSDRNVERLFVAPDVLDNSTEIVSSESYEGSSIVALARDGKKAIADTSLLSEGILVASTPEFVELSWPKIPDALGFRVYKQDRPYAEVNNGYFRDEGVREGDVIDYRIETIVPEGYAGEDAGNIGLVARVPQPTDSVDSLLSERDRLAAEVASAGSSPVRWCTASPCDSSVWVMR